MPKRVWPGSEPPSIPRQPLESVTLGDVLDALINGWSLPVVVPVAIEVTEGDPLATAGRFRGDILRGLMEVPGHFWSCHPPLYERYRGVLRTGAVRRRGMTPEERIQFWKPLPKCESRASPMQRLKPNGGGPTQVS